MARHWNFLDRCLHCGRRKTGRPCGWFPEICKQESMKLRLCLYLAAISAVLLAALPSHTARRPRYGGTLRVELGATVSSLDPTVAAANPEEANAKAELDALLYDHRGDDGAFVGAAGSGAFRVSEWDAGKRAVFAANENYREGRPFVDSVEMQMGRSAHDRVLDLELNKTDFAQIPAEQARQAADHGVRVSTSQPNELLALVFLGPGRGKKLRESGKRVRGPSIAPRLLILFCRRKANRPVACCHNGRVVRHSFFPRKRLCTTRKKFKRKSRPHRS